MTEYYSRVNYTYSSGSANFSIPFSYIDKEHIKVFINGEETQNYTYLTSSQIQISDTLSSGDLVSVVRTTPINERMVEFTDTSILNEDTQNLAHEQIFDVMQEVYDSLNAHKEDVETLKPYIETAASNIEHIINIDDNMTDINSVASNIENINSVSSNKTNIDIVANSSGAINTVSNSINGVNTVASDISNVNTVANNIDIVDDLSEIVEIQTQIEADIGDLTEAVFPIEAQFNGTLEGACTDNQGILSDFGMSSYGKGSTLIDVTDGSSWEQVIEFNVGNDNSTRQMVSGLMNSSDNFVGYAWGLEIGAIYAGSARFWLSTNKTSWNVFGGADFGDVDTNTNCKMKVSYNNGTYYLHRWENNGWVQKADSSGRDPIDYSFYIVLGRGADFAFSSSGTINANNTYFKIGDEVVWNGTVTSMNKNNTTFYLKSAADLMLNNKTDINLSNLSATGILNAARNAFGNIHYDANDFSKIGAFWGVADLTSGSVSLPANGYWLTFLYQYGASGNASDIVSSFYVGISPGGATYTVSGSYPHDYYFGIRIKE